MRVKIERRMVRQASATLTRSASEGDSPGDGAIPSLALRASVVAFTNTIRA
jgi:hypothetical protein